jgi:non-specific serine/threonine protein kinase
MLETIREFGLQQLAANGEAEVVRGEHARYYLDLAERGWPHWSTPEESAWIASIREEQDNFRAALVWLRQSEDFPLAIRLIGAIWPFWDRQDQRLEGLSWLRQALVWSAGDRTRERVRILNGAAALNCSLIKDYDPAGTAWSEESLSVADEIDDAEGAIQALVSIACNALLRGDFDVAASLAKAGLARIRAAGAAFPHAACAEVDLLGFLGYIALEQHEDARAERLISDAQARKRELGFLSGEANDSLLLAVLAYRRGDMTLAMACCQQGLPHALASGGLQTLLFLLDRLAIIAGEDPRQATIAVQMGGAVERLHEVLATRPNKDEQSDRDRARAAARAQLGEEAFATAWAVGRSLRLEEAAALGLSVKPPVVPDMKERGGGGVAGKAGITLRELDVLQMIANGHTDQEIADALFLSRRTVNAHVAHILAKLDVETRRNAVTRGRELGVLRGAGGINRYT